MQTLSHAKFDADPMQALELADTAPLLITSQEGASLVLISFEEYSRLAQNQQATEPDA